MIRKRIKVKGIVQGVGFRPFVYRLAKELDLSGYVRNTTDGVDIEVQGQKQGIVQFMNRLQNEKPKASRVDKMSVVELAPNGRKKFTIKESKIAKGFTQISPDIATCDECLSEMNDATNRRHNFPFINCTNCGPRYSIIIGTPYDRQRTSMKDFKMCSNCEEEFCDIAERRFHAQPDCCWVCGPIFSLHAIGGKKIKTSNPIVKTAALLRRGKIIAIKGIGGFHIACDATNSEAVKRLRYYKNRPTKPFAIMAKREGIEKIAYITDEEKELINSFIAPIMLLKKKKTVICDEVAPNNPYLGVVVPYAPVHYLLLAKIPYLVMTSANIQDEPIMKEDKEVIEKLSHIVSFYLSHNRAIENRCDDSVGMSIPNKGFSILRRSRGYVPVPIELPFSVKPTLAVGPYLKNTFTLADKKEAYVSPHIGDLDNLETLRFFSEMVAKYKRWFRIEPELIVHDLHPDYLSTKIAHDLAGRSAFKVQRIGVQHHVAHIVSCLGENMVVDDTIGIAFDGTGFGSDGKIWGGEFFVGNLYNQRRAGHLQYLPLPGGDASIKKPYRIAIAYIFKLLGKKYIPKGVTSHEVRTIMNMIAQGDNVVYTSSMGRLFDCVASMLGLIRAITYEAEAAINLEYRAAQGLSAHYSYKIQNTEPMVIEVKDILTGVATDLRKGVSPGVISAKFHNTIVQFSLDMAQKLSKIHDVRRVCFSGGVFQNRYLLNRMISTFEDAGFDVYVHRKLPTNDGCISYGQAIYGNL